MPQEEPGTACLPGGRAAPRSSEEGHPQLQGWDGSWIWVQLVTFLGCSFSFPARSAQRWRRWQLHGSAAPVAAVRPRQDEGEAAAAPPARGQRLLPGTEAPFRALPGVSWQHLTPHTALTTPAPLGDRSQSSSCFGCSCSCGSLGSTSGSRGCPCLPLPSTTKEAEMPPVQLCVLLPCLPQGPQPSSGGSAGGGRAEGARWGRSPCTPGLCCRESRAFPTRAAILV